jgi:ABC-type glycerol-3-phosphate transport system permease component
MWFLFTVGWYVALSLVIPTAIGYALARWVFNTDPFWLALGGLVLGGVIAFYGLFKMLKRFKMESNGTGTPPVKPNDGNT